MQILPLALIGGGAAAYFLMRKKNGDDTAAVSGPAAEAPTEFIACDNEGMGATPLPTTASCRIIERVTPASLAAFTGTDRGHAAASINKAVAAIPNLFAHPTMAQKVLSEMAMTTDIRQFPKMRAALAAGDYPTAAKEMRDSRWFGKWQPRSGELANLMERIPRRKVPTIKPKPGSTPPAAPAAPKRPAASPGGVVSVQKMIPFVAKWEGRVMEPYKDSRGIWTVGVGFNLETGHAAKRLRQPPFNTTVEAVRSGRRKLTSDEVDLLLAEEIEKARAGAMRLVPNLAEHPEDIQMIVIDMVYNLGEGGFGKFVNTRKALVAKDYGRFASGLKNSRWYGQVGRRSKHHVSKARAFT